VEERDVSFLKKLFPQKEKKTYAHMRGGGELQTDEEVAATRAKMEGEMQAAKDKREAPPTQE
jgi:hypothetical protein